jgi:hypothetical protein
MIANAYEKTYVSVTNGLSHTEYLDKLVEIMRANREPMTCADLGRHVFGDRYGHEYINKSLSARMGQMLKHLRQGGFIKVNLVDGTPVTITHMGYVEPQGADTEPEFIRVHDDKGRTYDMPNPNYLPALARGTWGEVTETITPKIKVYYWVAE